MSALTSATSTSSVHSTYPIVTRNQKEIERIQSIILGNAVMNGELEKARQALANGADPNADMAHGDRALHIASSKGDVAIVRLLLSSKADLNAAYYPSMYTPLHVAAYYGKPQAVEILLQAKADANVRLTGWGDKPLEAAISAFSPPEARLRCMTLLIQAKANVNSNESTTALIRACTMGAVNNFNGQHETVRFLLDAKADPNLASPHIKPPLVYARAFPNIEQLLLERGAKTGVLQKSDEDEVVEPSVNETEEAVSADTKRARTTNKA
jgi:ankyrin repeat protein